MTDVRIDAIDDCARRLRILADPTRLEVMRALMDGARHVGELKDRLRIEQSLLSHHLRVLRDSGLVTAERDGKSMLYHLAPEIRSNSAESTSPEADRTINLGCCVIAFDSNR